MPKKCEKFGRVFGRVFAFLMKKCEKRYFFMVKNFQIFPGKWLKTAFFDEKDAFSKKMRPVQSLEPCGFAAVPHFFYLTTFSEK
jgi:hypothetical protein